MNYNELIETAIEKDELAKLLRGEGEYEATVSEFTSDVFPTDVNAVLVNCFYKQLDRIKNIDYLFSEALEELLNGNASDIYIALLYFDTCLFQEEKGKASFQIDKKTISKKFVERIHNAETELKKSVKF
ncbi:MAG: hypothetical protein Q4G11_05420, partial [Gallicola sp.]|nr:hypothetical protein [Gallicola sp.]